MQRKLTISLYALSCLFFHTDIASKVSADDWQVATEAYQFKPTHVANKCVDIPGGSSNAVAQQWDCFSPIPSNQSYQLLTGIGIYSSGGYVILPQSGGGLGIWNANNGTRVKSDGGQGASYGVWTLPAQPNGAREMRSYANTNKCIDVEAASGSNGAQMQIWDCLGSANQRFSLIPKNGYRNIRPVLSSKCFDVEGVSTSNGAQIKQWDCLGGNQTNQHWMMVPITFGGSGAYYQIVSRNSGKCLDVEGNSGANGAKIKQWHCLGQTQSNQLFRTQWVGKDANNRDIYQIKSNSNKCLDIEGNSNANGANVQQWDCLGYGQTNQLFYLTNP